MSEADTEIYAGYRSPAGFGIIPQQAFHDMSGLELLQGMIDGKFPAPPISKTLSLGLREIEEGRAVFKGMPQAAYLNPVGTIHGGWTATIMDSALACCVQSVLNKGEAFTTTEFKVNLIRPLLADMGEVTCEAKVVSRGRTIGVSECRVTDNRGRLLAFGTETCSIFPASKLVRE